MKALRTAAAAVLLVAIAVLAARTDAANSNNERRFYSARAGVGIEAPPGWTLSTHTGYPTILCLLVHPGGSRVTLAVGAAVTARDGAALAAESRPGLAAQGIEVTAVGGGPRGGVLLDARLPRRDQAIRQLYLVRPLEGTPPARQAIILTLTAAAADFPAASAALDWMIARLDLQTPVRPDDKHDRPDGGL
ncbi:MAG TPA: hypothetical protein VGP64_14175 [Polyangia bacterium]|jgi:hypothetical protein